MVTEIEYEASLRASASDDLDETVVSMTNHS